MATKAEESTIGHVISSLRSIRAQVNGYRGDCLDREEISESEDWHRISRRLFIMIDALEIEFGYEGGVKRND